MIVYLTAIFTVLICYRTKIIGWIPGIKQFQYIKIDLEDVWEVTKITVQDSDNGWYTITFRVSYSNDGYLWMPYKSMTSDDELGSLFERQGKSTITDLNPPIKARYLAFNPISYYSWMYPSLLIELFGCKHSKAPTAHVTTVGNSIDVDTTWIPSQSPIFVDDNLVVFPAATLTIQAGVSVIFSAESAGIEVWGTLISSGITGLNVLLSSGDPVLSAHSRWNGITQKTGGNVTILNTVIRQASKGIQGNGTRVRIKFSEIYSCNSGVRLSGGLPGNTTDTNMTNNRNENEHVLLHVNVHHNINGLQVTGWTEHPDIVIGHSHFDSNLENGISVVNWDTNEKNIHTHLIIFNSSFAKNKKNGISCTEQSLVSFNIKKSLFYRNSKNGLYFYRHLPDKFTSYIHISDSQFIETNEGINVHLICYYLRCISGQDIELIFINNVFTQLSSYAIDLNYVMYYVSNEAKIKIENNTFVSNRRDIRFSSESDGPVQCFVENNLFELSCAPLFIESNTLKNNVSVSQNIFKNCESKYNDDKLIQIVDIMAHIFNNSFENCSLVTGLFLNRGVGHLFAFNSFIKTRVSQCYISIGQTYIDSDELNINYNFWGTSNIEYVKDKICDFFLDSAKARASLDIYFTNEEMQTTSESYDVDTFRSVRDVTNNVTYIGGVIDRSVDLNIFRGQDLFLNRSLIVPKGAKVSLADVSITIQSHKGIKVYGSLTIGKLNDVFSNTELKLNGKMSYNNYWNGISAISGDVHVYSVMLQGMKRFLEIEGTDSNIVINNCSSVAGNIESFIYGDSKNGTFSLVIEDSHITASKILQLTTTNSHVEIKISGSSLNSTRYEIINIKESQINENVTFTELYISQSSFFSSSSWFKGLYFQGCSSHLQSVIKDSMFSQNHNSIDQIMLNFLSMDITALNNTFDNARKSIIFEFCGENPKNLTKEINVIRNHFKSSTENGNDLIIDQPFIYHQSHSFNIVNNTFDGQNTISRNGINCYSWRTNSLHTINIESNIFQNYETVAVGLYCSHQSVVIRHNSFLSNKQCIMIGDTIDTGLDISENMFVNNTYQTGIVYLGSDDLGYLTCNITENIFSDNNGTVIALRWQTTRLKYNFFDNKHAFYNLKILSKNFGDSKKSIDATLNYWGTSDSREISKVIYDSNFDKALLAVLFIPYLASKNISDIQNAETGFISEDGEIGGEVGGNVTLDLGDSPYIVVSNIYVEEQDTLTIRAGVILKVRQGVGFFVKGKLLVMGELELPVMILSEKENRAWRGIAIQTSQGCMISYLVVNDTELGVTITHPSVDVLYLSSMFSRKSGLTLILPQNQENETTVIFSHLTLDHNLENGLLVSVSEDELRSSQYNNNFNLFIQNSTFSRNVEKGIEIFSHSRVEMLNCNISENGESGVDISQNSGMINIFNSYISSNTKYAIKGVISGTVNIDSCDISNHSFEYIDYWHERYTIGFITLHRPRWSSRNITSYISIRNNRFNSNTADGITISNRDGSKGLLEVQFVNNIFTNGHRPVVCEAFSYRYELLQFKLSFQNNTFDGNLLLYQDNLLGIAVSDSTLYDIELKDNFVSSNKAGSFLAFFGSNINGEIGITGNVFRDNTFTSSLVYNGGRNSLHLSRNIFDSSNSYNCAVEVPDFIYDFEVNATYNYWGTHLAKDIVEKACGFEKNMSKSFVRIFPYFEDVEMSLLSDFNLSGGEITQDTTISSEQFNSSFEIYRSILIREGAKLTIEREVALLFAPNRGIYVQGSLSITGYNFDILLDSRTIDSPWYGIVVNISTHDRTDRVTINRAKIQNTLYGIVSYTPSVELKRAFIINSTMNCLTLFANDYYSVHDLENTTIKSCRQIGIQMKGSGGYTLSNAHIYDSFVGIETGIFSGSVEVRSCFIRNCSVGISVETKRYDVNSSVSIVKNHFVRIYSLAIILKYESSEVFINGTERRIKIDLNTFKDVCGIKVQTWNHVMSSFRDNELYDAICTDHTDCFMNVYTNGSLMFDHTRLFDISSNRFENITSNCIIRLEDDKEIDLQNMFTYNTVRDNNGRDGVILANSRYFDISGNVLDNPGSVFDIVTKTKGTYLVNATKNWWGSTDISHVLSRIFDQRRLPDLVRFQVEPVLLTSFFDCRNVKNCSTHGECMSPNRCRCSSGWTGISCESFDCSDINYCYGNGDCTGPNTCSCYEGWNGEKCITASCSQMNDCSGHGFCTKPNTCTCADRFTGYDCSSCKHNFGGPNCLPCPECKHGICSSRTGLCECESTNWAGYLCDQCNDTFYGPDCLPIIKILEIVPSRGQEKGGNEVHVWGHNFPETENGSYKCRFGKTHGFGKWLARTRVVCIAPRHLEGEVTLEISPYGTIFTNDKLSYFYYSTCPSESCGRNIVPSRGQCVFGSCSCYLPWKGENCSGKILPLLIKDVPRLQTVNESQTYTLQLKVDQGDRPIRWFLYQGPPGMTIDEQTGVVQWLNAVANSRSYDIEVRATNIISEVSVTWSLIVSLSYTVSLEYIDPSDKVFPFPRTVKIVGKVDFIQKNSSRTVPVEVIVASQKTKHETVINVETSNISPDTFTALYNPLPDDAGRFSVIAKHPGNTSKSMISIISWSVLGMKCEPSVAVVEQILSSDENTIVISNISTLRNVGDLLISNVTGEVDGLPGAFVRKTGDIYNTKILKRTFGANETVIFDLVITDAQPLYGNMYIYFTSSEGTFTGLSVHIKLSIKKPALVFKPSSIRESVLRGSLKLIVINITNIGEVSANNVSVSLPGDSRMSLVSFSIDNQWLANSTHGNIDILPTESARLSISVIIDENEGLGEMRGTIYINSLSASYNLPYTIFITSSTALDVTFVVKDEYTYFANGSPLVKNARIKLTNPRRGFSEVKNTDNDTGVALFEAIYEDRYTVQIEAESHSSYSDVILISSKKLTHDIFLPRIAVKYTWTVESTAVKDVYIIALESTFETYVPMPVVTIEPSYIDTLPLENRQTSTIEFTLTNHGLIRADNVRFSLPTSHPLLTFTSMINSIGSIAANSSIVVPVRTVLKQKVKRSSGSYCGDILLLYSFQCSGTQTRSALVRLSHGNAARSCGGLIYLNGRGRGYGSGFLVGYVSGTALTCDCLTTFFKSCVLAFIPGYGCPLAVISFVTADHSSSSVKDEVVGVLDMLMGCFLEDIADGIKKAFPKKILAEVLKRNVPVIEFLYTAVRCVQDVEDKCSGGRKRRDINPDILTALMKVSSSILNFIHMGKEIVGNQQVALEEVWYREFKKSVDEETQLGSLISKTESFAILDTVSEEGSKKNLSLFIDRYNNTVAAWENGTLSQFDGTGKTISLKRLNKHVNIFLSDNDKSKANGYDSIFGEFEYLTKVYYDSELEESRSSSKGKDGVCARVRIKIEQELVLTRDAFKAQLEIENGEQSDLENIKVEIQITPTLGDGDINNDKFSIGKAKLIGISSVDGKGSLGRDLSGSAEWLMIPYSNAAPEDATQYDVGGHLSYSVDGTEFSVPLLPDTIVVSPNPSLTVHYFHEKYVQGDDALTPEVEPVVPFTLAVMVMNSGYGVARDLKITSGQPEIIENKKGLLVSFKIIAAKLGNENISPSLTVDFGDISAFETKTARWFMTSTLMGTFFNFSATFENINPLGDPQLSLIDKLEYHALIHMVRLDLPDKDDGLDDFLVDNYPDRESIPDQVYDSSNGSVFSTVFYANITDIQWKTFTRLSKKVYKQVNVTLVAKEKMWFYTRFENTFTKKMNSGGEYLLNVVSKSGKIILVGNNAWQTTHISDKFFVHLFDFVEPNYTTNDSSEIESMYIFTYGPRNIYSPNILVSHNSVNVTKETKVGFILANVTAKDIDNDYVVFQLQNDSQNNFNIKQMNQSSVAVVLKSKITAAGALYIILMVKDDGIPPKSSSVTFSIVISDGNTGNESTENNGSATNIPSRSTTYLKPDISTDTQIINTTQYNEYNNDSDNNLSWIIPVSIGCFIMLVLVTVATVYILRTRKSNNDHAIELK